MFEQCSGQSHNDDQRQPCMNSDEIMNVFGEEVSIQR